ncbi:MAG: helix-turn-helix domain-containing protein [Gemmatimonadaceae bacterium]
MTDRSVACFPADRALVARLRGALGSFSTLEPFDDVALLLDALRVGRVSMTLVIVDASTFEFAESALRRIHSDFASHPLVAYYDPRGLTQRHLFALAQTGITDLVQLDVHDLKHLFGKILESAERTKHAEILSEQLEDDIPPEIRSVFIYALQNAGHSMDVPELAAALGVSKRTLAWRLRQQRFPSPRVFLTWCRLLVASLLLQERGRTLDSVAAQLDFPGGHSLGGVFFRYMGRGIIALREDGVASEVLAAFRAAIAAAGDSPQPT